MPALAKPLGSAVPCRTGLRCGLPSAPLLACCRGSQDATLSRTLFLHLPTRHPSSYPELDVLPLVQAGSPCRCRCILRCGTPLLWRTLCRPAGQPAHRRMPAGRSRIFDRWHTLPPLIALCHCPALCLAGCGAGGGGSTLPGHVPQVQLGCRIGGMGSVMARCVAACRQLPRSAF